MILGGIGLEPVVGRGADLAVCKVNGQATLVPRGTGPSSRGVALRGWLVVDVIIGGTTVLFAERDLLSRVAP